jgi:hypothetical protein
MKNESSWSITLLEVIDNYRKNVAHAPIAANATVLAHRVNHVKMIATFQT